MWEDVLQAVGVVALGWEAHNTLFEQVDFQRTHLCYQHIYTHVPFGSPDEQRVVNVLLDHTLLVILQILQTTNDRDLSPSRQVRRFADPHLLSLGTIDRLPREQVYELLRLIWQAVRYRREVVYFAEPSSVALDQACQVVLGAQDAGLWEVNQLLVRFTGGVLSHRRPNRNEKAESLQVWILT